MADAAVCGTAVPSTEPSGATALARHDPLTIERLGSSVGNSFAPPGRNSRRGRFPRVARRTASPSRRFTRGYIPGPLRGPARGRGRRVRDHAPGHVHQGTNMLPQAEAWHRATARSDMAHPTAALCYSRFSLTTAFRPGEYEREGISCGPGRHVTWQEEHL